MSKEFDFIKTLNLKEIDDCKVSSSSSILQKIYSSKCLLRDYLKKYPEDENTFFHPTEMIQEFLKNWTFISSGGWASVYSFNLNDTPFKAIYKTYLGKGMNEYITSLVLNRIANKTPNFMHAYAGIICSTNPDEDSISGLCEDPKDLDNIFFFELIEGETLSKWLKNDEITKDDINNVLSQIFFSLMIANYYFDFLHNDLHPDNIMITKLSSPTEIQYDLTFNSDINKIIKIKTNYLVKILDFGDSDINKTKVIELINESKNIKGKVKNDYMLDISHLISFIKNKELEKINKEKFIEEWIKINNI
jgi:thiamine kinase-like enzyme